MRAMASVRKINADNIGVKDKLVKPTKHLTCSINLAVNSDPSAEVPQSVNSTPESE